MIETNCNQLGLLVSVRSVTEAQMVVQAGVDILDIKEPLNGPLGKADQKVIEDIVRVASSTTPVSAAFGEAEECADYLLSNQVPPGLTFAKCGLAGTNGLDWPNRARTIWSRFRETCHPVAVAYADYLNAESPLPQKILDLAIEHSVQYFLLDTFSKVQTNVFNFLDNNELMQLISCARNAGIKTVLAGSLSLDKLVAAQNAGADFVGIRGAVCPRDRTLEIDAEKLLEFKRQVKRACLQND